jgi:AmiR/NasT family two-component response regulator
MIAQQRVVIAAQDERLCRSLREGLETLGFATWSEVSDGLAALTQIRRARPHLVVVAPPLPSLDGGQIAETLIRGAIAPVVLVAPEEATAAEPGGRESSFCGRLVRPFTPASLAGAGAGAQERFDQLSAIRAELERLQGECSGRMLMDRGKSLKLTHS